MTATERDTRIADLLALLDDANVREQKAIARAGQAEADHEMAVAGFLDEKEAREQAETDLTEARRMGEEWRTLADTYGTRVGRVRGLMNHWSNFDNVPINHLLDALNG